MTNGNKTTSSSLTNYYYFISLVVVVFSSLVSSSNAETVSISNSKDNDGWGSAGGLRRASIVTDLVKNGMFTEDNGFEGSIRTISDEIRIAEPATTPTIEEEDVATPMDSSWDDEEEDESCYVSFQKEDLHADDHCDYESKVISASEADHYSHTHILVADERCNYDLHTGYWYQAECAGDSVDAMTFHIVKAFCSGARCDDCYETDDLPDILGTPSGPVFHSWDEKVTAVCSVPTATANSSEEEDEDEEESLFVEFSGNCLAATCQ